MIEVFLQSAVLCAAFVVLWVLLYPRETLEALLFQCSGREGIVLSVLIWAYALMAVAGMAVAGGLL